MKIVRTSLLAVALTLGVGCSSSLPSSGTIGRAARTACQVGTTVCAGINRVCGAVSSSSSEQPSSGGEQ